jgi:F-type H+-transporting ATPase subunit epsilon
MANTFHVELITPEKHLLSAEIVHLRAPGSAGEFGILANHAPMVAGLDAGRLQIDFPGHKEEFAIGGGYFTVEDNKAIILAETCFRKNEIDLDEAKKNKLDAQKRVESAATAADREEAQMALKRYAAQVHVAEHKSE